MNMHVLREIHKLFQSPPQAHQREILDALPVGIGILTAGQCCFANLALRAMTDIQPGEPAPSPFLNAFGAPQTDTVSDAYLCLPRPEGGMGDFLCHAAPVDYEGEPGVILCLMDISRQKVLEKTLIASRETAEAAARERGRFLAMMSHEVRTPLNGIMGLLQLALLYEMDNELKGQLDTAFSLCKDLLRILSDMLDFFKMESGSFNTRTDEFSLANTVDATLALFQETALDKHISLECRMDPSLPDSLSGDGGRVHQLLLNLVGNAVKYTQAGQIELEVLRLPAHAAGTLKALFVVSDTGRGISAERMNNIFEPFQRGDDDYVLRQTGVGLGLAIVKRLVQLMDGELCVFSREGLGTENHLILPFKLPVEAETAPESADADAKNEDWGEADYCVWRPDAPRILIVDDEACNLVVTQLLLGALGYPNDVAENGKQALNMLTAQRYALVFMDIQMPGMDGYATAAAIRAIPGLEALPIVAFTAHAMQGDRENMLSWGFDEYMAKPVLAGDLQILLSRLLADTDD